MSKYHRGILYIFISVLLYSIMPVLIRLLGRGHIPPVSQVFLRYTVACAAAWIHFFSTKSAWEVARKDRGLLFLVAFFGYALVNLFYTYANLNTQIGTVLFIFNCSTVMGPLLGYFFLGEKLTTPKIAAMVIGFISLFFLFRPGPFDTWKAGAVFALISAIGSSFYVIGRKKLGSYSSATILVANTTVGVITLGILSAVFEPSFYAGGISTVAPVTWLLTILFGLDNFCAYLFMTKGYQLVSAGTGSMVTFPKILSASCLHFCFLRKFRLLPRLSGELSFLRRRCLPYPTRSNDCSFSFVSVDGAFKSRCWRFTSWAYNPFLSFRSSACVPYCPTFPPEITRR